MRMTRHWSIRLLGATLALAFGLAMAAPAVHQCPLHDGAVSTGSASHARHSTPHHTPSSDRPAGTDKHCTCPQAVGTGVAFPATPIRGATATVRILAVTFVPVRTVLPGASPHLLPFALAPPRALV